MGKSTENLPPPEGQVIQTETADIWLDAEGFLWVVYKSSDLNRTHIQENFDCIHMVGGGTPRPLINIVQDVTTTSKDARDLGASPEILQAVSALALVTDSLVSRMLGNFFIYVARPPYPTRLFRHQEDALVWLRQYL